MPVLVTDNIEIFVRSKYVELVKQEQFFIYLFSYTIKISNKSTTPVQLRSRFWKIFESTGEKRIVEGEGVVGETPILMPGDSYVYSSGCPLNSGLGTMQGYYIFYNLDTQSEFKIPIPEFKLEAPIYLN